MATVPKPDEADEADEFTVASPQGIFLEGIISDILETDEITKIIDGDNTTVDTTQPILPITNPVNTNPVNTNPVNTNPVNNPQPHPHPTPTPTPTQSTHPPPSSSRKQPSHRRTLTPTRRATSPGPRGHRAKNKSISFAEVDFVKMFEGGEGLRGDKKQRFCALIQGPEQYFHA